MGIPLVALMGRSPQILDYGQQLAQQQQIQRLKNENALAPGQLEMQNLQIQEAKQQMAERQALNEAYKNALTVGDNGQPSINSDALSKALATSGHGAAIPEILKGISAYESSHADLLKKQQDLQEHLADTLGFGASAIQNANYDPNVAHLVLDRMGNGPQIKQMKQLVDNNPAAFKQMVDTAVQQSPKQQQLANAIEVAKIRASKPPEGELKLTPEQIAQYNSAFQRRFQVLNPGKPLPTEYTLPTGSNQKDFDRIDKLLTQTEQAQGTKAQQEIANQTRQQTLALSQQARQDTRSDKSYQFAAGQLDKSAKPIEDAVARFGRLQDTINQKTPQADALVAPELLTVMAGGQGSGLRMNEAEISRIVGGRSHLENLKAALNKWSVDPTKALSITDEQRGEIRALMTEVHSKLLKKQEILDQARQDLVNAANPNEHRQIITDTHKKLTQIDVGGTTPQGGAKALPSFKDWKASQQ